jgi:hypothetical protein
LLTETVRKCGAMAKGRKGSKSMPVRLDEDVIECGRIVAPLVGKAMNDLFSEILRPILQRMKVEELERELSATRAEAKKHAKGKE